MHLCRCMCVGIACEIIKNESEDQNVTSSVLYLGEHLYICKMGRNVHLEADHKAHATCSASGVIYSSRVKLHNLLFHLEADPRVKIEPLNLVFVVPFFFSFLLSISFLFSQVHFSFESKSLSDLVGPQMKLQLLRLY